MKEIIGKTNAQKTINIIAEHLLEPSWIDKHKNMNAEERNTLLINHIFKKYPNGFKTYGWMIKQIIKTAVSQW